MTSFVAAGSNIAVLSGKAHESLITPASSIPLRWGIIIAVLIEGATAADFRKGEETREEITDLMAGGAQMAALEAEIEAKPAMHEGRPRPAV